MEDLSVEDRREIKHLLSEIIDKFLAPKSNRPKWTDFNINNRVRVKLTLKGHEIYEAFFKETGSETPPLVEDEDGKSVWMMWQIFEFFGASFYQGRNDLAFESNIEIVLDDE